jgi:hypothetical protein
MNSENSFPPPSPIQRILLFHLNLHETCTGGKSLGEGATLEELSEQILYYHRDRRIGIPLPEDDKGNVTLGMGSLLEEAVQFLGLCTALYTLPTSLGVPTAPKLDGDEDRTQAVYFGNSTLVFTPLEDSVDIVAIVQVARLYQNGTRSDAGSGNPRAIRASIERCHQLFCMLRRGGILYRLKSLASTNVATSGSTLKDNKGVRQCPYNGMDTLFALQKEIRKSKHQQSRINPSDVEYEVLSDTIRKLQIEVRTIRQTLPIQSIRRDLDAHYKEYLSDFSLVVSRNGGAGRCLVEMMPIPVAHDSGSHTFQLPPETKRIALMKSLGQSIRKMLDNYSPKQSTKNDFNLLRSIQDALQSPTKGGSENNGTNLVGLSLFNEGHLLQSYTCSHKYSVPASSASLLMAYMATYRTKINSVAHLRHFIAGGNTSSAPQLGFSRLTLSIGSATAGPQNSIHENNREQEPPFDIQNSDFVMTRGRFMSPPPDFMLNCASDRTYAIPTNDTQHDIWAPRVHLSLDSTTQNVEHTDDNNRIWDVHTVLFDFLHFSFLLFLKITPLAPSMTSESDPSALLLLMKLEEELSNAVNLALRIEMGIPNSLKTDIPKIESQPGQDVLMIDRATHKMVLLLDPKVSSPPQRWDGKRESSPSMSVGQRRRFLAFGLKKKNKINSPSSKHWSSSTTLDWSALGLDCRHLLASRLPLDVCLAFDDMINEIARRREAQCTNSTAPMGMTDIELCTCMPHGWIYAYGKGDKDLYTFFDSSIYVTVSDVLSAALKIQAELMVD